MQNWRKYYPWLDSVSQSLFAKISTLWVLGSYKAPGTWGSLAGSLFVAIFCYGLPRFQYAILCAILIYLSVGICDIGEKYFNEKDPGKINFDEFAVMPLCYFGVFSSGAVSGFMGILFLALGFGIFRFFDILKPLGIYKLQSLEGGLGCAMDDVLAAFYTCIVLNILKVLLV